MPHISHSVAERQEVLLSGFLFDFQDTHPHTHTHTIQIDLPPGCCCCLQVVGVLVGKEGTKERTAHGEATTSRHPKVCIHVGLLILSLFLYICVCACYIKGVRAWWEMNMCFRLYNFMDTAAGSEGERRRALVVERTTICVERDRHKRGAKVK